MRKYSGFRERDLLLLFASYIRCFYSHQFLCELVACLCFCSRRYTWIRSRTTLEADPQLLTLTTRIRVRGAEFSFAHLYYICILHSLFLNPNHNSNSFVHFPADPSNTLGTHSTHHPTPRSSSITSHAYQPAVLIPPNVPTITQITNRFLPPRLPAPPKPERKYGLRNQHPPNYGAFRRFFDRCTETRRGNRHVRYICESKYTVDR